MKKVIACIASAAIAFSMTAVAPIAAAPQKAQAAAKSMTISSIQLSVNSGEKPGPDDEQEMGDAVLVKSGGKFLLMDTGAEYVSNSVVSYLKNAGVKEQQFRDIIQAAKTYISKIDKNQYGNLYDTLIPQTENAIRDAEDIISSAFDGTISDSVKEKQ
jgi:hypothetical protein